MPLRANTRELARLSNRALDTLGSVPLPPRTTLSPGRQACRRVLVLHGTRCHSTLGETRRDAVASPYVTPRRHPRHTSPYRGSDARSQRHFITSTSRQASLLASSTTQIPTPFSFQSHSIPASHESLHGSLIDLNDLASDLVNQSRLQLALRGLESAHPTTRIAILGASDEGFTKAKRLARLLIADPLDKERTWEKELTAIGTGDNRAVLLKYGEVDEDNGYGDVRGGGENPLLKTIAVKSHLLGKQRLELLIGNVQIGPLNNEQDGIQECVEAALLPVLDSPLAGSGRTGFVRLPVHKAILLGEGFGGAITIADYLGRLGGHKIHPIFAAADLPVKSEDPLLQSTNVIAAEKALEGFRLDVRTGPVFSETWQSSGLSKLSNLLQSGMKNDLPKPIKQHIDSLIACTEASVTSAEASVLREIESKTVSNLTRNQLDLAISAWSEYAHTELRDTMIKAFASPLWRRTSFPRVLWRIDDVSFSASQLLHSSFLIESETYLAFLTGRVGEAGFFSGRTSPPSPSSSLPPAQEDDLPGDMELAQSLRPVQTLTLEETRDKIKAETGIDPFVSTPWPVGITACRHSLLRTLVPSLHARAQSLVLQCLGLVGTTSALGIWYVIATAGTGIYEAGAIVGLGSVWALRRLQKYWGTERSKFESEVQEQGRLALGEVETRLRGIVRDGQRPQVRAEDSERWVKARELISRCRYELHKS
ncbi:hypothetical protein CAC42_259 [Sphaceloma murrayae]|uniref:Mmc1 C-terminal domain-containing protein n=1 Tax=Sphaceloma murrayae TaxID=2082308 RepID=A0A2K1QN20_9PEZI|nr:hypothetical protein CAC42_259 [Sphaceloma murrayae]